MTIIVAKKEQDGIHLVADSRSTAGECIMPSNGNIKILQTKDGLCIASAGDASAYAFLKWFLKDNKSPKSSNIEDVLEFMCEFDKFFKEKSGLTEHDNDYIMVFKGKIFSFIAEAKQLLEEQSYAVIGSGGYHAISALTLGYSAKEAAELACELVTSCGLPLYEVVIQ